MSAKLARMRYVVPRDHKSLNSWYNARGETPPSEYPTICFIMPQVASGGLIPTQGSICLIEGLITNPRASAETRKVGLDSIIQRLIDHATSAGYKYLVGLTKVPYVVELAHKHSFRTVGDYTMVSRKLKE